MKPITLQLGIHHFAYLRAVANGLSMVESAKRYLGVEHGNAARKEHARLVSVTRALAKRRGDARWRLLGLEIASSTIPAAQVVDVLGASGAPGASRAGKRLPTLEEWSAQTGVDDFDENDRLRFYVEAFGVEPNGRVASDGSVSASAATSPQRTSTTDSALRHTQRNARLLAKRLDLLQRLQNEVAVHPRDTDHLAGWLPEPIAKRLVDLGDVTLADLARRIARGGRWWQVLPAYGIQKATALHNLLSILLPQWEANSGTDWAAVAALPVVTRMRDGVSPQAALGLLESTSGLSSPVALTSASNDRDAVEAWLNARASHSVATRKGYTREAERFLMWLRMERQKDLRGTTVEDCVAYMRFIEDVPEEWISRRRASRFGSGWAPFRGPLTRASQRLCLDTLHSLFTWLQRSGYLRGNPWLLVDTRLDDDRIEEGDYGTRAFTPAAWKVLMQALETKQDADVDAFAAEDRTSRTDAQRAVRAASVARLRWMCVFVQSVGLRSTELLKLTRGDLKELPKGWVVKVEGKGRRKRSIPVPHSAMAATREYFAEKGVVFEGAPANTPMLSALADVSNGIGYQALYATFTAFVRRTIKSSSLSPTEKSQAIRASGHWLRHTYATRSAERGMPLDILQENMGQSDPRVTARYYRAQMERRQAEVERVFGEATQR